MHPYVHCSVIYSSQDMEATQVPLSRQVDKKWWYAYTVEYYSAIKNAALPFMTAWMDLEDIMLSKISQRNKNTV